MLKGLLILTAMLTVLMGFNFFAIKLHKAPMRKQKRLRKSFLIAYGLLMTFIGVAFILLDGKILTGWFYILIGIGFPIANLLEYRKKGL